MDVYRKAMFQNEDMLRGIVEMDETYVGGKPRKWSGKENKRGRGTSKVVVVGMVERGGRIKAAPIKKLSQKKLEKLVRKNIDHDKSLLVTDKYKGYDKMQRILPHISVDNYKILRGFFTSSPPTPLTCG